MCLAMFVFRCKSSACREPILRTTAGRTWEWRGFGRRNSERWRKFVLDPDDQTEK